jgi:electron transfer flavoprotein-quinone oxidoreductase
MLALQFDVIVVGAGAAGLTAAIGLARAGVRVAVLEAGSQPGGEQPLGAVWCTRHLADPDVLGPEGVAALPRQRNLVERGLFATDGLGLLGLTYRDADAFRDYCTVLHPDVDRFLARRAEELGVTLILGAAVESLIRHRGRVVGVCSRRGPLYAELVFLAEGDAASLVTREGYERSTDPRDTPRFRLLLQRELELPAGVIEERFGLGAGEGASYQVLLRNGTLHGREVPLNATAVVHTNRDTLSLAVLLPLENLRAHFAGNPRQVLDWFEAMPALRPWFRLGRGGGFTARLLRDGGARDMPYLIDDGLVIGGTAAALRLDFPWVEAHGPATFSGLLLARAVRRIRETGGRCDREQLLRHYAGPLQQSNLWRDVEFLRLWPGYAATTPYSFGRGLDLVLGSAYVWTRRRRWLPARWVNWLRLLGATLGPDHWHDFWADTVHLLRALRWRKVARGPSWRQILLDGSFNALRDLFRRPRAQLPRHGTIRLHYTTAEEVGAARKAPATLRRWFARFAPVLAASFHEIAAGDDRPLSEKLAGANRVLWQQINSLDLLVGGLVLAGAGVCGWFRAAWGAVRGLFRLPTRPTRGLYPEYARAVRQATDLTHAAGTEPFVATRRLRVVAGTDEADAPARDEWPTRELRVGTEDAPAAGAVDVSIHVLWPGPLPEKNTVAADGLWRVCPTGVFELLPAPPGRLRPAVHPERCVACEACWRASALVDWGRSGHGNPAAPAVPGLSDPWEPTVAALADTVRDDDPGSAAAVAPLRVLIGQLDGKLTEYETALACGSHRIDRSRGEHLELLARYAQQLAARMVEVVRGAGLGDAGRPLRELVEETARKTEERGRRTWDRRFAWAAADGRQVRRHHLEGLRRLLGLWPGQAVAAPAETLPAWLCRGEAALPEKAAEACRLADDLCGHAVALAVGRSLLPGQFQDEDGRDTLGKFGAVKKLVAGMAARRYLVETLERLFAPDLPKGRGETADLLAALVADALGPGPGGLAWGIEQICTLAGAEEDEAITALREQATSLRLSGPGSAVVFARHGKRLLAGERPGALLAVRLRGEDTVFETLRQRRALHAELQEVRQLEERLSSLVKLAEGGGRAGPAAAESAEKLGRLDAHLLAARALLLQTHARLERGVSAALEVALVRVWLEETTYELEECTCRVRRRLEEGGWQDWRPVLDPGTESIPPTPYQTGDFLVRPLDLARPRPVPEFFGDDEGIVASADGAVSAGVRSTLAVLRETGERLRTTRSHRVGASWRLQRLAEARFIAEALAFSVWGCLRQQQTPAPRLEVAIADNLVPELGREVLALAEEVRGEVGARTRTPGSRDRRTTDTGPGWLPVLEDLVERVAPSWRDRAAPLAPRHLGWEALELEAVKGEFLAELDRAFAVLGRALWQDPNLQAAGLLLAEAAGWLAAADTTLGRVAWLSLQTAEESETPAGLALGRRALTRCLDEVRLRLRRFAEELVHLRGGYYPAGVRAASLLLDRATDRGHGQTPAATSTFPTACDV